MWRFYFLVLLLPALTAPCCFAHKARSAPARVDGAYVSALAAANRFLNAWQAGDKETGIVMLSDLAREHTSPEQLQEFFSPGSTPAYEIAAGKRLKRGTYSFPIVLFDTSAGPVARRAGRMIMQRRGNSEWAVGQLP
jgi:hypothetical protein